MTGFDGGVWFDSFMEAFGGPQVAKPGTALVDASSRHDLDGATPFNAADMTFNFTETVDALNV